MIMRKIDTKSPYTARQIVVHGHVSIGDRFVNPGHIVRKEEENRLLVHLELSKPSSSHLLHQLQFQMGKSKDNVELKFLMTFCRSP